jgi:hypothetical protein
MRKDLMKAFHPPFQARESRRNSRLLKSIMQVIFVITLLMLVFVASYRI